MLFKIGAASAHPLGSRWWTKLSSAWLRIHIPFATSISVLRPTLLCFMDDSFLSGPTLVWDLGFSQGWGLSQGSDGIPSQWLSCSLMRKGVWQCVERKDQCAGETCPLGVCKCWQHGGHHLSFSSLQTSQKWGHRGTETLGLLQSHGLLNLDLAALGGFITGYSSSAFPGSGKWGNTLSYYCLNTWNSFLQHWTHQAGEDLQRQVFEGFPNNALGLTLCLVSFYCDRHQVELPQFP